jgi:hypothetical protein
MKFQEILGKQFERWTVLEERQGSKHVMCRCQCGTVSLVLRNNILSGKSKSCGCLNIEAIKKSNTSHGYSNKRDKTYSTWLAMHRRCDTPADDSYKWYGGKGIYVCDKWKDFSNFLADMGPRPEGKEISRKHSLGPYCKDNCEWLTHEENCNNQDH